MKYVTICDNLKSERSPKRFTCSVIATVQTKLRMMLYILGTSLRTRHIIIFNLKRFRLADGFKKA